MTPIHHQDPRAKRTRLLLQQALGEMLTERSLASVTIADITRRAGVNRATFYAHFQDKDDLLESTLREKCRRVLHEASLPQQPPSPEAWRHLIQCILDFFAAMPCRCPQATRLWSAIVMDAMQEELSCRLEDWLPAVSPLLAASVSGAIIAAGRQWLQGKASMTTAEAASELTALLANGLPCNLFTSAVSQSMQAHTKASIL